MKDNRFFSFVSKADFLFGQWPKLSGMVVRGKPCVAAFF